MEKSAQRRSVLNKLREVTNVSGIAAEKFFNPEFERVMDSLRAADNKIRSVAAGASIDGEDAGDDPISIKELLKSAKSYLNRREYMTAIAFLGRFHKKLQEMVKIFQALNLDVDKVHHDFLFKDLDEDQKKHLHDLKGRFASPQPTLVAEASIMDFLVNVGTQRGRALAAWEKRYPKQVGKLKKDAENLYAKSDVILRNILSTLKDMAKYRASRKVDDYMKEANKLISHFTSYDKLFKDFYNTNIKGFLEKQEFAAPTKEVQDEKNLGNQEVAPDTAKNPQAVPDLEVPSVVPPPGNAPSAPPEVMRTMPVPAIPKAPSVPTNLGPATPPPDTQVEQLRPPPLDEDMDEEELGKASHQKFFETLQALGNEKPELLKTFIVRYARSIKDTDPQTAIQLMNISKNIGG